MERFMNIIKERSKYKTISHVEKSYLLNTEATHRSIIRNRALFGCTSLRKERPVDLKSTTSLLGVGKQIMLKSKASLLGLTWEDAVMLTRAALRSFGTPAMAPSEAMQGIEFFAYARAELCGIKLSSAASSSTRAGCRSYQSSFVRVAAHRALAVDPSSVPARSAASFRGSMYAYVQCYFRVCQHSFGVAGASGAMCVAADEPEDQRNENFALLQILSSARQQSFVGTKTIVTTQPSRTLPCEHYWIAPIDAIQSQLMVLKTRAEGTDVRFVECPGKLVVSSM